MSNYSRTYYHVSPAANAASIGVLGINQDYALTKSGGMYLVTASYVTWAVKHTQKRHGVKRVVIIPVTLPRRWSLNGKLTKFRNMRGVWRCHVDICPCKMGVMRYAE